MAEPALIQPSPAHQRQLCIPGDQAHAVLHPDDYFAFGTASGDADPSVRVPRRVLDQCAKHFRQIFGSERLRRSGAARQFLV